MMGSDEKKYLQIKLAIIKSIEKGRLHINSKLPSINHLMAQFKVSKNTIINTINELMSNHYIYSKDKVGYFIADRCDMESKKKTVIFDKLIKSSNLEPLKPMAEVALEKQYAGYFDHDISDGINKVIPFIDKSFKTSHPQKKALKYILQHQDLSGIMGITDMYGLYPLRSEWIKYLSRFNIKADISNTFIGGTNQRTFNAILFSLVGNNVEIMTVQPSRFSVRSLIITLKSKLLPLQTDDEGITIDSIKQQYKSSTKHKILYIETIGAINRSNQTSKKRMNEIYELCYNENIIIIENDYRNYVPVKDYNNPIKSIDKNSIVIYINSFENLLNPTGHNTIVVAPESYIKNLAYATFQLATAPSVISQIITMNMLKENYFLQFLDTFIPKADKRIKQVITLLKKYFTNIATWYLIKPRYTICLDFHSNIKPANLNIKNDNVIFHEGEIFGKHYDNKIFLLLISGSINDIKQLCISIRDEIKRVYKI